MCDYATEYIFKISTTFSTTVGYMIYTDIHLSVCKGNKTKAVLTKFIYVLHTDV